MPQKHVLQIEKHEKVAEHVRRLTLSGNIAAKPGQFVQVEVSATHDPYLMRPISVHDNDAKHLSLLYRVAGRGTELLAKKNAGESLHVIGPLGNGFTLTERPSAVVIGGGIGAAPLYYLLNALRAVGKEVYFFFGAKSKEELFLLAEYQQLVTHFATATDDGSAGFHGLVTELAKPVMATQNAEIYACGPTPMLRAVSQIATAANRRSYVSLEAKMACGVGACLGCVVPVGDGYKRVCVDGPVFTGEEVFSQ